LVLGWSSASRTEVAEEEELGASIPTVLEWNISWVILNVVRIRRDYHYGVLHRTGVSNYSI
jgi:hypothetical protein